MRRAPALRKRTIIKKVRMAPQEAARLRSVARELNRSESDVIREGLALVERVRARRRGMRRLIELAEQDQQRGVPKKVRFELR